MKKQKDSPSQTGYYHPSQHLSPLQAKPGTIPPKLKTWLKINIALTIICGIVLFTGLISTLIHHQSLAHIPDNTAPLFIIPGSLLAYVFIILTGQNNENPYGAAMVAVIISMVLGAILLANSIASVIYFFQAYARVFHPPFTQSSFCCHAHRLHCINDVRYHITLSLHNLYHTFRSRSRHSYNHPFRNSNSSLLNRNYPFSKSEKCAKIIHSCNI